MTPPEWWYTGYFIGLTIFLGLLVALIWWMLRWGKHEVVRLERDIVMRDQAHIAFEAEVRRKMWPDER